MSTTLMAALSDSEYNISISFIFNLFSQEYCGAELILKKYKSVLSAIVGLMAVVVSKSVEVILPVTVYKSSLPVNNILLEAIVPATLSIA